MHGYVTAAGEPGGPSAPGYTAVDGAGGGGEGEGTRGDRTPAYGDVVTTRGGGETYPDYSYRRGEEDGALAEKQGARRPVADDEVRRINEERRKRMRAGGFTNWVLRRKGKSGDGDAVVR